MDVLEEMDLFGAFVLATSINPELAIEYLPVLFTCDVELGLIANQKNMYIDKFPHILGRPWTPQCVQANKVKIRCYNGFITNISTENCHIWRESGWYESYEVETNNKSRHTTNPNNLLISYYNSRHVIIAITKFGIYYQNINNGVIVHEHESNRKVEIVNNYQLDKPYYDINGKSISGIYNGVLYGGVPIGFDYYYAYKEPTIQTAEYGNIECSTIPWDEKPVDVPKMPIIRSLADLVANFPTFE